MILKSGYEIIWDDQTGKTCGDGGTTEILVAYYGKTIRKLRTCICGRGCNGLACVRDDWGYHDTDIEYIRAD